MADKRAQLWVLAGTNGAGKSSIGGAMLRAAGGDYFNPDEFAAKLRGVNPDLDVQTANAKAWNAGVSGLRRAIEAGATYFYETTLGGHTVTSMLEAALAEGHTVRVWYVGLETPELHIARVAARVREGGHAIGEADIRRRYDSSRMNLVRLLPALTELKLYDNSIQASLTPRIAPRPKLLLHCRAGKILAPAARTLRRTPGWAKPIVAAALKSQRAVD